MLHKIVTDTLNLSSQKGFTSVALPALGTGNLGFPRDIAAATMFNAISEFSKMNSTSIKDVRIVLYHKDQPTIDASITSFTSLSLNNKKVLLRGCKKLRNITRSPSGGGGGVWGEGSTRLFQRGGKINFQRSFLEIYSESVLSGF